MTQAACFENYPAWIVLACNAFQIAIYAIGAFLVFQLGWVWLLAFAVYVGWMELRVLQHSCVNCFYFGKWCAFGKGKLANRFFKKGDPKNFLDKKISWKDILPDFLVSLIPAFIGIGLLLWNFNWLVLGLVILLILFTFLGNAFVRGSLACKHCKQRELGCPAQELFQKAAEKK